MVRLLVGRYADGARRNLRGSVKAQPPVEYPDIGLYHPRMKAKIGESVDQLPRPELENQGTVGLLVLRSYLLAGNAAHYDGTIAALEARGLHVVPAFASGLDAAPGDRDLLHEGRYR
jgi:magnesium chelatase subunit H